MRLTEWQRAFEQHLLAPPGVDVNGFDASLIGGPTLDVKTGLAIYHNAYRARLQEVLREDFATVWHWLGDEEFARLVGAYIDGYPSTHFSLRWFGERFAGFIDEHLVAEQAAALSELARLEWAFTLAFDAPQGPVLTLDNMARLAPQDWPGLQAALVPSAQTLLCRFNSLAQWQSVKEQAAFPQSEELPQAEVCLIWRDGLVCRYRTLDSAQALALMGMADGGWTFAELCSELAVSHGEGAPLQAVTWLKQWILDGLLVHRP